MTDEKSKVIPLVVYDADGTRRVVGEGKLTLEETGIRLEGHVSDPEVAKMISASARTLDGFSLKDPPTQDQKE